jgi:hypothetical protein
MNAKNMKNKKPQMHICTEAGNCLSECCPHKKPHEARPNCFLSCNENGSLSCCVSIPDVDLIAKRKAKAKARGEWLPVLPMTVGELRRLLAKYPDDLPVALRDSCEESLTQLNKLEFLEKDGKVPYTKGGFNIFRNQKGEPDKAPHDILILRNFEFDEYCEARGDEDDCDIGNGDNKTGGK